MADEKFKTIKKILDAAAAGDEIAARQALDDYAAIRAVQFSEWVDCTKASEIKENWETLADLYIIFRDRKSI